MNTETLSYQPQLRPALPFIQGPKEYREQRDLFLRIDEILTRSGLEQDFLALSIQQHDFDLAQHSAKQIDFFTRSSLLALRSNIARHYLGLDHRSFCARLADSDLLRWFLQIQRVEGVKTFAKSSSDRFAHWLDQSSLHHINQRLISLLAGTSESAKPIDLGLAEEINFENIYFDSTCLKAPIHYPVDWVLLRDITRTLMKATLLIRRQGLRHRMPQEPLEFLSDINTHCMEMTAKFRTKEGRKHRKTVLRKMKALTKRIGKHARKHLVLLEQRGHETELTPGRIRCIRERLESVLAQLPAAIEQAHERIIGGRQVSNDGKIFSIYDHDIDLIKRGKSNAEIEFGNKLWLGETREGLIVDYLLEKDQTSDSKHIAPAITRLVVEQKLPIEKAWGDRGLQSVANDKLLEKHEIYNGLCPRSVSKLTQRLKEEPELRVGLKRRAGTEARISILIRDFMGTKPRAKGLAHRQMMVGWAVLSHNLWVLARLPQKEPAEQKQRVA